MSDNIKVVVKVRPLIPREIEDKLSYQWLVKNDSLYQLGQFGKDVGQCFTFDKVYDKDAKTKDVYNDIAKPIVECAISGVNGTIFAYGQTSSGKTYTMSGSPDSDGIIQLAVLDLFNIIKNIPNRDFLVRVSYIEIYNEQVKDLLDAEKKVVKVCESYNGVKVEATEKMTSTPEEIFDIMKEGESIRQIGATNMNEESSRSHTIFQITIESREHVEGEEQPGCVNVSQLNLVDLAGSERAGQTGATGMRFKEGTLINKSLLSLAMVINQLSEDPKKYVNYRDSKLTRILQNSLGGNAKTSIICAITPAAVDETISTLHFANRAKAIKNKPEVNAVSTENTKIQSLTKQLCSLKAQLESKKSLEKDNMHLSKQIATLQRLILNGFSRRSTGLSTSSRRKTWCAPLQPDEPAANIPPLNYNPIPQGAPESSELHPPRNMKLASVPEESVAGPTTSPLPTTNEIIEIDSDDDEDAVPCSPYHRCYGKWKTPPCILRNNTRLAEKNYKDIIELTKIEKMYKPNVVELLEKLEDSTTVIASLKDQIDVFNNKCQEKDLEIDMMKSKISNINGEVIEITNRKVQLETKCKEYETKITDLEVSYETLQNKAKRREEELLSLLNEHKLEMNLNEDISERPIKTDLEKDYYNFMDLSKDISLVNSDIENSAIHTHDEYYCQDIISKQQNQQTISNNYISDTNTNLLDQKQKILSLETMCRKLENDATSLRKRLDIVENENKALEQTIETLNTTVTYQKTNLEAADSDIKLFNNLIRELQTNLYDFEKQNVDLHGSLLEKIVSNEQEFIANKENMDNLVVCFKKAIESRNNEISGLKASIETQSNTHLNNVQEELQTKDDRISILTNEIHILQKKIDENIYTINKCMSDKNNLLNVEKNLTDKLLTYEKDINDLKNKYDESNAKIISLNENNEMLQVKLAREKEQQLELSNRIKYLLKQIDDLTQENVNLLNDIQVREKIEKDMEDCITKAKFTVDKVQGILKMLTGEINAIPTAFDNYILIFTVLYETLHTVETKAADVILQKNAAIELNSVLIEKHTSDIADLQEIIDAYKHSDTKQNIEITELKNHKLHLETEFEKVVVELDIKNKHYIDLQAELINTKKISENLRNDLLSKEKLIETLRNSKNIIGSEDLSIKQEFNERQMEETNTFLLLQNMVQITSDSFNKTLLQQQTAIIELDHKLQNIINFTNQKMTFILDCQNENKKTINNNNFLLEKILQKVITVANKYKIEINMPCELNDINMSAYEKINIYLDNLSHCVEYLANEHITENYNRDNSKNSILLSNAKDEIIRLTDHNINLVANLSKTLSENDELLSRIEEKNSVSSSLNIDLIDSNNLLKVLKEELKTKSDDLYEMVQQTKKLNEQFKDYDTLIKKQMEGLNNENIALKSKCAHFEMNHKSDIYFDLHDNCQNEEKFVTKPLTHIVDANSPKSLQTLCCNKIIDAVQPAEDTKASVTNSFSNRSLNQKENTCTCDMLSLELQKFKKENIKLKNDVCYLKFANQNFLKEQEEIRKEIQLLMEPAMELQKKVINHRTSLYTLTATTYTENKLLNSKVKVLQHHHDRLHSVSQKDLSLIKKQLQDLFSVIKTDDLSILKRYSLPDVLDKSSIVYSVKNESTLDPELLMLDGNSSITSANTTLIGHDQTCVDLNQIYLGQTPFSSEENQTIISSLNSEIDVLAKDNQQKIQQLQELSSENMRLKDLLITIENKSLPINIETCKNCEKKSISIETLREEIRELSKNVSELTTEREDISKKYLNLNLKIPETETLVRKINCLEKENNFKLNEIEKLTNLVKNRNRDMQQLQEENDTLSTQIIDNISESDDLRKEVDKLKAENQMLYIKYTQLVEVGTKKFNKSQNENLILSSELESHLKLERSHSDSDSSSRCNKISTLQNELHASQEDCKKLTEEVATIKNHFDMSMGMDLDESMEEPNIFNNSGNKVESTKLNIVQSLEESISKIYSEEKNDCLNYYVEITGSEKSVLKDNMKIIDVMKLFYNNLVTKHSNEVENFINQLRDLKEYKNLLQEQLKTKDEECNKITNDIEIKSSKVKTISNALMQLKEVLKTTKSREYNFDIPESLISFKEILLYFDEEFEFSSADVFQSLLNNITKNQKDLTTMMTGYTALQEQLKQNTMELDKVNDSLTELKTRMTQKENEYTLLQVQNKNIYDISSAVTLDIVKKEQALRRVVLQGCQKLKEHKLLDTYKINTSILLSENLTGLFDSLIDHSLQTNLKFEEEKHKLESEVSYLKTSLHEKVLEVKSLKLYNDELKDINVHQTKELDLQRSTHDKLKITHESLLKENETSLEKVAKEIILLKDEILKRDKTIEEFENKLINQENIKSLKESIQELENECSHVRNVNTTLTELNKSLETNLQESNSIIENNKVDIDNMTVEILNLRESIKNNVNLIDNLKQEVKLLSAQNLEAKIQYEEADKECSRLKTNIKTHEKTAEIQSGMIIRLQKENKGVVNSLEDKIKTIDELTHKYGPLESECEGLTNKVKTLEGELSSLQNLKDNLKLRVSELELELEGKARLSLDAINSSRRRRQSLVDSYRLCSERPDNENKMEAVFASRSNQPEELFTMDVDEYSSNRSTPIRLSRGRDSSTNKDQSSEEGGPRASGVHASRRRRQSTHDTRRHALHDASHTEEINKSKEAEHNNAPNLKEQLTSCQQELEELKERFKEVDEECEICSQYLQERDEQCMSLRKEKIALEKQVMELNEKLKQSENGSGVGAETKHVSVNTDEDWSNLHSVFVDRMSFDAEVEKNKKLVKGLEEFRMKNRELKAMLAKAQRALEQNKKPNTAYEAMELELQSCKEEIQELRKRCEELDEECEICGEYLREKDEIIRKLKEAKSTVMSKSQDQSEDLSGVAHSMRKKRQSLHDQNRESVPEDTADFTEVAGVGSYSEGEWSHRDGPGRDLHLLQDTIKKLTYQKSELEQQLSLNSASHPTGSAIVQNQQMADLIKQNHKLKKINAKLINICKKRGKNVDDIENEDPSELR